MKQTIYFGLFFLFVSLAYADTSYIYGGSLLASKTGEDVRHFHQDSIGSNRIITDEDGLVVAKSVSYPFGMTFEDGSFHNEGSDYKFTGKEKDGTLYYYGARYYKPRTMSFLSLDAAGEMPYGYVLNNPLKFVDPTGSDSTVPEFHDSSRDYYFDQSMYNAMGPAGEFPDHLDPFAYAVVMTESLTWQHFMASLAWSFSPDNPIMAFWMASTVPIGQAKNAYRTEVEQIVEDSIQRSTITLEMRDIMSNPRFYTSIEEAIEMGGISFKDLGKIEDPVLFRMGKSSRPLRDTSGRTGYSDATHDGIYLATKGSFEYWMEAFSNPEMRYSFDPGYSHRIFVKGSPRVIQANIESDFEFRETCFGRISHDRIVEYVRRYYPNTDAISIRRDGLNKDEEWIFLNSDMLSK